MHWTTKVNESWLRFILWLAETLFHSCSLSVLASYLPSMSLSFNLLFGFACHFKACQRVHMKNITHPHGCTILNSTRKIRPDNADVAFGVAEFFWLTSRAFSFANFVRICCLFVISLTQSLPSYLGPGENPAV